MATKIGLLTGREWSFPPAFVEEVQRQAPDIEVEYLKLGALRLDDPIGCAAIVDRISHAVPYYRTYLKHAAMRGVRVINDPFVEAVEDRFAAATTAHALGIALPRMIVLPHREYVEGIVHEESLRNLDYPLNWQGVMDHVGTPCLLKDAHESGEPGEVCRSVEELLERYNASGRRLMVVQEMIQPEQYVRCFVIGRRDVLSLRYDPEERRYHVDHEHLTPELGRKLVDDSLALVRALGYDVNTVDWAIRGAKAYAVDFVNPVPEIDIYGLTPNYFDWVVQRMAETAIRAARGRAAAGSEESPRRNVEGGREPDAAGDLAEELPNLARDLPKSEL